MNKRIIIKTVLILAVIALATSLIVFILSSDTPEQEQTQATESNIIERETLIDEAILMVELNNLWRLSEGINELTVDKRLFESAQYKSDLLCETGVWSHEPDGEPFEKAIQRAGYPYVYSGENLAKGFRGISKAFDGLLNSPTHYENIMGEWTDIGVGYSYCGGKSYYAIHYGLK